MSNSIYYFVMVPMVYMAFATLVLGLAFKFFVIIRSKPIKGSLVQFPHTLPGPIGVLRDSFLMPSAFKKDKVLWFFLMLFHGAFLLLILGHLELVQHFDIIQIIPHKVFLGNGAVGLILILSTLYFLFRRFKSPYREISVPEDFLLLMLLFLTMVFGSHMNMASEYGYYISVTEYREYMVSLISLQPKIPGTISTSPHYILVVLHIFFANLFIMIFPFSKMIHAIFIFFTQNLKRK